MKQVSEMTQLLHQQLCTIGARPNSIQQLQDGKQ